MNEEGTTGGGGAPPIPTPQQPYPQQPATPYAFPYQHAAYNFPPPGASFSGYMPASGPSFPPGQPGPYNMNFPQGLPTPNQTPSNLGKRLRMDRDNINADMDDASFLSSCTCGCMEKYQQLRDEQKAINESVQRRLEELEAAVSGAKEASTIGEGATTARIPELEQLVHTYAFQLMDIQKSRGPATRTGAAPESDATDSVAPASDTRLNYTLPDPGGHLRGNPELKVPNWTVAQANSDPVNKKFQYAILELIKANEEEKVQAEGWSDDVILQRIRSAFRTFVKRYRQQNDPAERAKAENKNVQSKIHGRQKNKLDRRVGAFPEFAQRHGKEATRGYRQLLQKGAMSSDDDKPGKADKEAWDKKVGELRGTTNISVWETHRLLWRNVKVVQFYYALDKISSEQKKVTVNSQRFHGFKENDNEDAPKKSTRDWKLYDCMICARWAKAKNDNTPTIKTQPDLLDGVTIADDELFPTDREEIRLLESYYGDDEWEN
ncbi:hypothetical protein MD484_g8648, partial [Candolleomyces efflorescens]